MTEDSQDRIVIYERTMRDLLKVDMAGFSTKQIQEHVGDIKAAWERFIALSPSASSAETS